MDLDWPALFLHRVTQCHVPQAYCEMKLLLYTGMSGHGISGPGWCFNVMEYTFEIMYNA